MKTSTAKERCHSTRACAIPTVSGPVSEDDILKSLPREPGAATLPATDSEMYEQGSKTCHQYSDIVTRIRTLAQQLFIAFAVGAGIAFSRSDPSSDHHMAIIMLLGGTGLALFAIALWILSHHYSLAFEAIRDSSLVELERAGAVKGPWTAHKEARLRSSRIRQCAWHGPFLVLVVVGLGAALTGTYYLFGPVPALVALATLSIFGVVLLAVAPRAPHT